MAEVPSNEELAAQAGYTVNYFKVTDETWNLFKKALREEWEPFKLQQAMRNTKWYKNTSQSAREAHLLKSSDPAEYKRRHQEMRVHIDSLAMQIGYQVPGSALRDVTKKALLNGWGDEQIRRYLGSSMGENIQKQATRGKIGGDLATIQDSIFKKARNNGIKVSRNWVSTWLHRIGTGAATQEEVENRIALMAESAFPGFADEIHSGMDMMDIASPYIESMANLLEINGAKLDLYDPTIRKALTARTKDGPEPMSLADFEVKVRDDPRWMQTKNARDGMMSTGREVLSLMSLVA